MKTKIPIFYVTTDPIRALGIEDEYEEFYVICTDYTDVVYMLEKKGITTYCIEKELGKDAVMRNSRKLLLHEDVQEFILNHSANDVGIVFFKPLFSLDTVVATTKLGKKRNIISLNASPSLSSLLENKLNFLEICTRNTIAHPESFVENLQNLSFEIVQKQVGTKAVVQFERGWFGNRTFFVSTADDLEKIRAAYSNRKVKVSQFIPGTTLTVNGVVTDKVTYQTYPFIQINDDPHAHTPLAGMQGSTIGNVWTDLESYFGTKITTVTTEIYRMVLAIGTIIREMGYRGFFGVDILVGDNAQVFMQEINPRFTASTQMISQLENEKFGDSLLKQHYQTFGIQFESQKVYKEDYFTRQLNGARVVARHVGRKKVTITNAPHSGVYSVVNDDFTFVAPSYDVSSLDNSKIILHTVGEKLEVSVHEQMFEVQSKNHQGGQLLEYARTIKKNYF